MKYMPNSSASVTAPTLGRANSTTPNATDTSPETMNIARVPAVSPLPATQVSASDLKVIADVNDTARHPGRIDHCVVLGPRADVAGQRDCAVLGDCLDVAVVGNQ